MSDSITNTNTKIANTVEDFFAELLKLLDQSDIYDTDVSFLRSLGKDGQSPNMVCVDTMIAKRMVKEMEAQKIPYMQFRIRATGKDIILVSPEMMSKMQAIENSIRIHAGLELDTKAELDRALAISEPGAKEYIVEGLTEYEADKILSYSANAKKSFVVVKEEMSDGKFLVATHEKNKVAVNYYAAISMFEDSNVGKEMASIVEGQAYLTQQRKEIEQAVDEVRNTNETKPAYVFSLNEPEKYVKINETSFEIHDRGNVTHRMNIAQNPELYADALKLICNSLPNPVFKLESEVQELGGMNECLRDAKAHIPNGTKPKNYPIDAAFKNWFLEQANPQNGYIFEHPEMLSKINVEEFKKAYLKDHPFERETLENKTPYLEKQLKVMEGKLKETYVQTTAPLVNIDDTLARNGFDVSTMEEFYDDKEVRAIKNGIYQEQVGGQIPETHEAPIQPIAHEETKHAQEQEKSPAKTVEWKEQR